MPLVHAHNSSIGDLSGKAAKVGEDSAAGAAAGSVVGPWGTVVGGAAGAIYGAVDQFGGDVAHAFNPPHFSEADYERFRQQCRDSGGSPTPGVAPDNYGGCTYPDGRKSGGDNPRPDWWNGKRMAGQDTPPSMPPGLCPGPFGIPMPCAARPAPRPPPNFIARMPTVRPRPVIHFSRFSGLRLPAPRPSSLDRAAMPAAEPRKSSLIPLLLLAGAGAGAAWWLTKGRRS